MSGITAAGQQSSTPADAPVDLDDHPAGERYFRHPGDVVRLVLWGLATWCWSCSSSWRRTPATVSRPTWAEPPPGCRRSCASWRWPSRRSAPSSCQWPSPSCSSCRRRWRRLVVITVAGLLGAAVHPARSTAVVDLSGRSGRRGRRHLGRIHRASRRLAYLGGAAAATDCREGRGYRGRGAGRATSPSAVLALVLAIAGTPAYPDFSWRWPPDWPTGCAVLVIARRARTGGPTPAAVCEALSEAEGRGRPT